MELRQAAKKIRLIALDLDGSCMNSQGIVTGRTRRIIGGLIRKGYLVVPATGRGFHHLREDIIGVEGIRYVISDNGAIVTDGLTGRRLTECLIPRRTSASLAERLLRCGTLVYIHCSDARGTYLMACRNPAKYACFARPGWVPPKEFLTNGVGQYLLRDGRGVTTIGAYFDGENDFSYFETIIAAEYRELHGFRVADHAMEFTCRQASKADALRGLCRRLQIPPEQTCAIGDNGNDVELLRTAGLGVAMGNAIPEAKQAADVVVKSNDEDGAAEFFEKYFLT